MGLTAQNVYIIATLIFIWGVLNLLQGLITLDPYLTEQQINMVVAVTRVVIAFDIFALASYLLAHKGDIIEQETYRGD